MDLIEMVSNVLGAVCLVIGILLIPLGIWFLRPGIKERDMVSLAISIFVFILATGCFIGAYSLFTQRLIQQMIWPLG